MKKLMATICFAFLAAAGCGVDRTGDVTSGQDDSTARTQEAVESIQSNKVTPDINLLTNPFTQQLDGPGGKIICIRTTDCVSCCDKSACCSSCNGAPPVCT